MRNQWRLLLLSRSHLLSHPHIRTTTHSTPLHLQVHHSLHSLSPYSSLSPAPFVPSSQALFNFRCFSSSELAVDQTPPRDHTLVALTDIFTNPDKSTDEIRQDLQSNNVVINHDLILEGLKGLFNSPDAAKRVFNWVLEHDSKKLSSKSYNLMVGILGSNGFVQEFWDMVGVMKNKGYGVSKGAYDKVFDKFVKDGLSEDLEKLKELYVSGSTDNSLENLCSRVCKVIRRDVWGAGVETRLRESGIELSSELVAMVLENLATEQSKGLIFFRWVEESGLFKHDERTYNAMVRVLGREDSTEKFWRVVDEMRNAECEIERQTYVDVSECFVKRKMLKDAVDLYEFAMRGRDKPSVQDSTFLMKKIVVGEELDMDLFSRVVRAFTESGNVLKSDTLHAVLKSLMSVGRIGECSKILKSMQESGFQPSDLLQGKIAYLLGSTKKAEEASEFMANLESCGEGLNRRAWASLVEGYCSAGDVVKASESFRRMTEKEATSSAARALDLLVSTYCRKNKGKDAYKLVSETLNEKPLHAEHSTYKTLIGKLLAQGGFNEALDVLCLMKNQGYPPFLDPFIKYLSKKGTADDAITFTRATTVKRFPSTSVFLRVFEAYFKAGRHSEAQDFLSRCPRCIKNHADVLNLFCSMKAGDTTTAPSVAA